MAVLEELTTAVQGIAEKVGPAVVGLGRGFGRGGSGVVVAEGRVVTNAHNLRSDEVVVTFADGRAEDGEVAGADPDGDLAVISVDTGGVTPVELGDAAELGSGSVVFALANPGGRGLRTTLGLVSATERSFRGPRGRRFRGGIEHSAPLPRGETVARPRLGVAIAPARVARRLRRAVGLPERDGLLVHGVERGGPADVAGLQKGDLLVAAGGRELARVDDLHAALASANGELRLVAVHGVDEREVVVALERGEDR